MMSNVDEHQGVHSYAVITGGEHEFEIHARGCRDIKRTLNKNPTLGLYYMKSTSPDALIAAEVEVFHAQQQGWHHYHFHAMPCSLKTTKKENAPAPSQNLPADNYDRVVTITYGDPDPTTFAALRHDVQRYLPVGSEVYADAVGTAAWNTTTEQSGVIVARIPAFRVRYLIEDLARIAGDHQQEAIGLQVTEYPNSLLVNPTTKESPRVEPTV